MIQLTRLNDRAFVLNAEQIKTIESTPDTLITLLNGDQILVKEPLEDVVRRAIDFGRSIRTFSMESVAVGGGGPETGWTANDEAR